MIPSSFSAIETIAMWCGSSAHDISRTSRSHGSDGHADKIPIANAAHRIGMGRMTIGRHIGQDPEYFASHFDDKASAITGNAFQMRLMLPAGADPGARALDHLLARRQFKLQRDALSCPFLEASGNRQS